MKARRPPRGALVALVALALLASLGGVACTDPPDADRGREAAALPAPVRALPGQPVALAGDRLGVVALTGAGEVVALDASGRIAWRAHVEGAEVARPALADGRVALATRSGASVLDRGTGATVATVDAAGVSTVALHDDGIIVGTEQGGVHAFDRVGARRWSTQHPGAVRTRVAVDTLLGVVVAVWHADDRSAVRALDLATGSPRWSRALARRSSGASVAGGLVVVGEGDGEGHAAVRARALADGELVWSAPAPASFHSGIEPAADGDAVAIVDAFGGARLLDLRTGRQRWAREVGGPVLRTDVVLCAGSVAWGDYEGAALVVDRADGASRDAGTPAGFAVALAPAPGGLIAVAVRATATPVVALVAGS